MFMQKNARCAAAALLLGMGIFSMSGSDVAAEDNVFCVSQDVQGDTRYYSAIFIEDYSESDRWKREFVNYLYGQNFDPDLFSPYCFFEDSLSSAERSYDDHFQVDDVIFDAVRTNWAPDNFSNMPLQDFNIRVSSYRQEIEVCVRDHECEDGDKVRVSVNGSRIFSGEIDNDWVCDTVDANEGDNRVELYAVNGTGRKGNCSYADVNTGEIRVEGKNTETQSWRHRGGAGSSASIIVTID